MQNKANFQNTKMFIINYMASTYANFCAFCGFKNKANQSQNIALAFYPYILFYQFFAVIKRGNLAFISIVEADKFFYI